MSVAAIRHKKHFFDLSEVAPSNLQIPQEHIANKISEKLYLDGGFSENDVNRNHTSEKFSAANEATSLSKLGSAR